MKWHVVLFSLTIVFIPTFSASAAEKEWSYSYSQEPLGSEMRKKVKYRGGEIMHEYMVQEAELYENNKAITNPNFIDYRIWNIFQDISGDDFVLSYLGSFTTYRGRYDKILGTVNLFNATSTPYWGLVINANGADFRNPEWTKQMSAVLVHEFAHILTLKDDEVSYSITKARLCKETYMTLKGCSDDDAYINAFVSRFWDVEDFTHEIGDKSYYRQHRYDFLTLHAVKNPEEDIAESFTEFIFTQKPEVSKKERTQKVLFFYEYPELVELRTHIRTALEAYFR